MNKTLSKIKSLTALTNGTPMSIRYFYSKFLQSTINQWILSENYDAIICFSSPMAEYIFRSRIPLDRKGSELTAQGSRNAKSAKKSPFPSSKFKIKNSKLKTTQPPAPCTMRHAPLLIIDFCDLDSDKWRQYSEQTIFPLNVIYKLEFKRLLQYEKKVNQTFDHTIFVSQPEADLFNNHCPDAKNISIIPNGVDSTYFDPTFNSKIQNLYPVSQYKPNRRKFTKVTEKRISPGSTFKIAKSPILLFTGAMDYHANIDGVTWFCSQIFPKVRQTYPDAQFFIVGSNPHPDVKTLANGNGIHVTGYVKDIRPYYQAADLCVAPIRLARGIQNKVLEAMAMEKPMVSTSQAIQGIEAENKKHLLIEDTPHGFSKAVVNLLKDDSLKKTLKTNARTFVEKNYTWPTHMKKFEALLDGIPSEN